MIARREHMREGPFAAGGRPAASGLENARGHRVALLLPVLAALAAYANALPASFQFDDYNVIVDNPAVHGLAAWWASMPGIRPLLKLSYALNWAAGPGPFGFHLVNLACHALNTVMVYLLAVLWLPRLAPDLRPVVPAACTAALVFALHPAQTEAVTYVAGRSPTQGPDGPRQGLPTRRPSSLSRSPSSPLTPAGCAGASSSTTTT